MSNIFCCSSIRPYRPQRLDHEHKFDKFMQWAKSATPGRSDDSSAICNADYVVQIVKQINYGPQESTRYFALASDGTGFAEVTEDDLIKANFQKLNSYKNFKCNVHDRFFEVNLYQEDPINTHHWRANVARPATEIDLAYRQKKENKAPEMKSEELKPDNRHTDPERSIASNSAQPDPSLQTHEANLPILKSALRLLHPTVTKNLGSNPLLSLLALDWADKKLNLGLEMESLWTSYINSDNIITFLYRYANLSANCLLSDRVFIGMEDAVGAAIRRTESLKKEQMHGRSKFEEIVNETFRLRKNAIWVSLCREGILRLFTAGPDEQFLELWQNREGEEGDFPTKLKFVESREADRYEDNDTEYGYNDKYNYNYYDDYESASSDFDKDLTACDKECGYCGKCPY
ncbi:hypothetical protein V8C35DRAFT_284346 [Trichoderma chlorosporum]